MADTEENERAPAVAEGMDTRGMAALEHLARFGCHRILQGASP